MAKTRHQRSERELSKCNMRLLWGYCNILKEQYQEKSYKVLYRAVMDEERRQRLAAGFLARMAELNELQKALTVAIDACGDEDDD